MPCLDLPTDEYAGDNLIITVAYPQHAVNFYKAICEQEGGVLLVIVKEGTYECTIDEEDTVGQLIIQNMAQCVASVDDCEGFPKVKLLVPTLNEFGMECEFGIDDGEFGMDDEATNNNAPELATAILLRQRSPFLAA